MTERYAILTALAALAIATPAWAANDDKPQVAVNVSDDVLGARRIEKSIVETATEVKFAPECVGVRVVRHEDSWNADVHLSMLGQTGAGVSSVSGRTLSQHMYVISGPKMGRVTVFIAEEISTPLELACLAAKALHQGAVK